MFQHAVLNTDQTGVLCPQDFSIVRMGQDVSPRGAENKFCLTKLGQDKWALVLNYLEVLKDGEDVRKKLTKTELSNNPITPAQFSTPPDSALTPTARPPPPKTGATPSPGGRMQVKRNLMEDSDFDQPAAKRSASEATHQVQQINPYVNKYVLKVCVEQKASPRQIHTARFQGTVLDCILSDFSGNIKLSAWNDEAKKMDERLVNGSTYLLTGARVGPVKNQQYNTTGHNYELTWTSQTSVTGPLTNNPVLPNYNFVPINSLSDLAPDSVVDVAGWAKEAGQLDEFRSKAEKDLKKRIVVLADNSAGGSSIEMTLWGGTAVNFSDSGKILAVRGAKLNEFQGKKTLNIGFSGCYSVEPSVPGIAELKDWADGLRGVDLPSVLGDKGEGGEGELTTIRQIKEELAQNRAQRKFLITATPIKINTDKMFYRAHNPSDGRNCRKGVGESGPDTFSCPKCGDNSVPEGETVLKYIVSMCLSDCSSYAWAKMFSAESLFGLTAPELSELKNDSETNFLELINKVQFSQMMFSVSAKVETYNDQPKLNLNIEDATKIDWESGESSKQHVSRLWKDIQKMEKEMRVSHEEEYGIDLQEVIV